MRDQEGICGRQALEFLVFLLLESHRVYILFSFCNYQYLGGRNGDEEEECGPHNRRR